MFLCFYLQIDVYNIYAISQTFFGGERSGGSKRRLKVRQKMQDNQKCCLEPNFLHFHFPHFQRFRAAASQVAEYLRR